VSLVDQATAGEPVTQPTAQQMLRTLQAYVSVVDGLFVHPVTRTISVKGPVVQLRILVIVVISATVIIALAFALVLHYNEPQNPGGPKSKMPLPSSQFDWAVQATWTGDAQSEDCSYSEYATKHPDLMLQHEKSDGRWNPLITVVPRIAPIPNMQPSIPT
jgi:hypothetical protein